MNAEKNSLVFSDDGNLVGMAVVAESLKITGEDRDFVFSPMLQPSRIDPEQVELFPLYIKFTQEYLLLQNETRQEYRFDRKNHEFRLLPFASYCKSLITGGCNGCSGCSG